MFGSPVGIKNLTFDESLNCAANCPSESITHNIFLVEDAAQAQGARYRAKRRD